MAEPVGTRRSVLGSLSLALVGAAGLWRFLTPRGPESTDALVSVPVADVPAGGALVLPQHRLAVVRQAERFLAFDLTCTHLACTVTATADGFVCPCHGSHFDSGGRRLDGPAQGPLRRLVVEREGDLLQVRRS
jgi:cytochrome b6-f complex iron-sulfur subunit